MTVAHAQEKIWIKPDISTALVKMSSKAVPQNMCSHPLIETGMLAIFAASLLQRGDAHRIVWIAPRKQPMARSGQTPVGSQDAEQPRRQHHVTVLAALAKAPYARIAGKSRPDACVLVQIIDARVKIQDSENPILRFIVTADAVELIARHIIEKRRSSAFPLRRCR
jgi:hypothetical protein